jgi:hypothetical protein
MERLNVSGDKKRLEQERKDFFYCADTAWELAHCLTSAEAEQYFNVRASQGFNAVYTVLIAERDGLRTPNADGNLPFAAYDKNGVALCEGYFRHIDKLLDLAEANGIYLGLLPMWGDKYNQKWGTGPEIFTPASAADYAEKLCARYRGRNNIVWILGGDRPLESGFHTEIIDRMGAVFKTRMPDNLISFHPNGSYSSTDFLKDRDYIDFNMTQSGHGLDYAGKPHDLLAKCRAENKPYIDGESRYEGHPVCWKPERGYWTADDVRFDNYVNVLSGAFGVVYGHHAVWQCCRDASDMCPVTWGEALVSEGATQLKHLKAVILSNPLDGFSPRAELAEAAAPTRAGVTAEVFAASGNGYAYIYSPRGVPFYADTALLGGNEVSAEWFDPRSGRFFGKRTYRAEKTLFVPSARGDGNDALLCIKNIA